MVKRLRTFLGGVPFNFDGQPYFFDYYSFNIKNNFYQKMQSHFNISETDPDSFENKIRKKLYVVCIMTVVLVTLGRLR